MRALAASFFAWIAAAVGLFIGMAFYDWLRTGQWLQGVGSSLGQTALFLSLATAIVVFSTCLLMVTPLLRLLPGSSPLWQPHRAAAAGAGVGPIVSIAWVSLFYGPRFLLDFISSVPLIFAAAASMAGAVFGFTYAKLRKRTTDA